MIERVRNVIAAVLLVALLAVVGFASIALVRGTYMVTPILSGSMRPGLAVGGVVVSQRVPVKSLAVRDVIVFRRPDKPSEQVVHRIVRLVVGSSGQTLINTQGDANTVRDPWTVTLRGSYAYRARWSIPLIGYVAVFFQDYRGFIVLLAGIVLLGVTGIYFLGARQSATERPAPTLPEERNGAPATPPAPRPPSPCVAERVERVHHPQPPSG